MIAGARVVHHPIAETARFPRVVVFEGPCDEAEGFFYDYIERDDVDDFYVELCMVTDTGREVPWQLDLLPMETG